mgnify:CR=1 FL=1
MQVVARSQLREQRQQLGPLIAVKRGQGHVAGLKALGPDSIAQHHFVLVEKDVDIGHRRFGPGHLDPLQRTFLYSRAHTIYGGSNQVQRNVIGERVLGLPREPR